jgi:hypothetical protein
MDIWIYGSMDSMDCTDSMDFMDSMDSIDSMNLWIYGWLDLWILWNLRTLWIYGSMELLIHGFYGLWTLLNLWLLWSQLPSQRTEETRISVPAAVVVVVVGTGGSDAM